jgi:hypothetical protein
VKRWGLRVKQMKKYFGWKILVYNWDYTVEYEKSMGWRENRSTVYQRDCRNKKLGEFKKPDSRAFQSRAQFPNLT